jgi:tetratricopeptide (TPR) repeat protein
LNRTYYGLGMTSMYQIHFNAGIALERLGDYAGAEREYRLADAEFAYSAPLIDNLAYVQFRLGKHEEAEKNFLRAIGTDPDYANAYNNYGLLMQQSGRTDSALALYATALSKMHPETADPDAAAQIMVNIAEVREQLGDTLTAAALLDTAVVRSVRSANVLFKAAAFYARRGGTARGDSLFEAGLQRGEPSAADWFNSGLSHLRRGQTNKGVERMHQAIAVDSALHQAYFTLAAAHRDMGSPRDSVEKYLDLCLRYNARYTPAIRLRDEMK